MQAVDHDYAFRQALFHLEQFARAAIRLVPLKKSSRPSGLNSGSVWWFPNLLGHSRRVDCAVVP